MFEKCSKCGIKCAHKHTIYPHLLICDNCEHVESSMPNDKSSALYTVRVGLRNGVDIKETNLTLKVALDKTSSFLETVEAVKAVSKCVHAIDISVIRQDSGTPIWTVTF